MSKKEKETEFAPEKPMIPPSVQGKFKDNYFRASEISEKNRNFIKLCPSFDVALGGGLMSGQIIEVKGVPKSGKSTASIELAKKAQEQFGSQVHYMDIEHRLRGALLDIIGIKKEDVHTYRSVKGSILTGSDYLKILTEICEDFENCFIIVDSIPLLSFADSDAVANSASRITETLKKLSTSVELNNHFLVLLNHEKEKIDFRSRVKQFYSPGGQQIQYGSSTIIRMNTGGKIYEGVDEGKRPIGHKIYVDIVTSPIASPCRTELNLIYGKGIDKDGDVFDFAKDLSLIKVAGAGWTTWKDIKSQGKDNFISTLKESNKWQELVDECYKTAGY